MAKCSDFEAVAAYDLKNHFADGGKAGYVFIIDTDTCGVGICRCLENGEAALIDQFYPVNTMSVSGSWSEGLKDKGLNSSEIEDVFSSGVLEAPMWGYYTRGKSDDSSILSSAKGGEITYGTLDDAFSTASRALLEVTERGIGVLEHNNIDEEALRILIVGRLSSSAAVGMTVRGCFTFDPILSLYSDTRFADTSSWPSRDRMIEEGIAIIEMQDTAKEDIILRMIGTSGYKEDNYLARKGQKIPAREDAVFSAPIFVTRSDCLHIYTPAGETAKSLPDGVVHGNTGLIEICCVMSGNIPVLLIRDAADSKRIYEIALS